MQAFLRVTLPLSVPGIISGVSMVFLPAMTNYVVLDMLYNSTYIMGSLIGSYFCCIQLAWRIDDRTGTSGNYLSVYTAWRRAGR